VLGAVIVIVIVAVVLPVLIIMSGTVVAALFGYFLTSTAEHDHEGSELIELNR
jgi:hypothetical protein